MVIDTREIEEQLKRLVNIKNGVTIALTRAINRSVTGMKTDSGKDTAAKYNLKQKDVKSKITVQKANRTSLSGAIVSKGRPVRLVRFKIKANVTPGVKGGATVFANIKKGETGGSTGGFMATMKNGHEGVFVRTGIRKVSRPRKETIRQLYSLGVAQMLDNEKIRENIQTKAIERFKKNLDQQVNYLLNK